MDVHPADRHHRLVGRKGFHVDLAAAVTVERVAHRGPNLLQIELVDAAADLLVARETDSHRPVGDFRVLDEPGGRFHDDGHARLVVGPQQGRAVAGDQGAAAERLQLGVVGHADHAVRRLSRNNLWCRRLACWAAETAAHRLKATLGQPLDRPAGGCRRPDSP